MHQRYISLLLVLSCLLLLRVVGGFYLAGLTAVFPYSGQQTLHIAEALEESDSESLLARGDSLCFWDARIGDFLLLPGVGDTIAERLFHHKAALYHALFRRGEKLSHALQQVHGVGTKKAEKLAHHLETKSATCTPSQTNLSQARQTEHYHLSEG